MLLGPLKLSAVYTSPAMWLFLDVDWKEDEVLPRNIAEHLRAEDF